jgi:NADH-quinone oxidoreductase subunit F
VLNHRVKERYFVCNAGEHEPGTFKDRHLLKTLPHQLIEGCLIASYTVRAKASFIYVNHEYHEERENLKKALAQAKARGFLGKNVFGSGFDIELEVFEGHGSYVAGEETAMLESIEGKRGQPRIRPPFPAVHGLYGKPTVVNNVETLANLPPIVLNGADWYKQMGTPDSAGVKVFSLSGRVRKPGNVELPFGATFRELIYEHGGGVLDGRPVRAIMPAGASSSFIVVDDKVLDTPMDYASVKALGADLGSASVIVIDDTVSLDWVIQKTLQFFKHESCGKCTPCREGTYWMLHLIDRARTSSAPAQEVELLLNVAKQMQNKCLCPLGEFSTMAVVTAIERFPQDFQERVGSGR